MIYTLQDQIDEAALFASSAKPRIPLGFPFFDTRTGGGVTYGEMTLFLARTGVGKTFWALNVIANNPDVPCIFYSLEMAARAIVVRLAAVSTDTPDSVVKRSLTEHGEHWALDQLPEKFPHLTICDEAGLNLRQMGATLDEVEEATGDRPRLVVIDYLELIKGVPGLEKAGQVSDMARDLKTWARMHDVHLVVIHQVPRGEKNNGHQPLSLFSGRYGGEDAADYVLGAYRPFLNPDLVTQEERDSVRHQFVMQFLKTRGGHETHEAGVMHHINPESGKISPITPSPWQDTWEL